MASLGLFLLEELGRCCDLFYLSPNHRRYTHRGRYYDASGSLGLFAGFSFGLVMTVNLAILASI